MLKNYLTISQYARKYNISRTKIYYHLTRNSIIPRENIRIISKEVIEILDIPPKKYDQ